MNLGVKSHLGRLLRFAIVSGTGLTLDLTLFLSLVSFVGHPFAANIFSSAAGLTFVYFASVRRVFRYEGQFLAAMFATYALYHLCGTLLVSWGVTALIASGWPPPGAKILILPMTLAANYLFMSWLTSKPLRWVHITRR